MGHSRATLQLLLIAAGVLTGCFGDEEPTQERLKGRHVYKEECQSCHEVLAPRNRQGPHLVNILDREAGTVATFPEYSPAFERADFSWNAERLKAFIKDPQAMVPGTSMAYAGLEHEEDVAALITYLKAPRKAEKAYQQQQEENGDGGDGGGDH